MTNNNYEDKELYKDLNDSKVLIVSKLTEPSPSCSKEKIHKFILPQ